MQELSQFYNKKKQHGRAMARLFASSVFALGLRELVKVLLPWHHMIVRAVELAVWQRQEATPIILHSDRRAQFTSGNFQHGLHKGP